MDCESLTPTRWATQQSVDCESLTPTDTMHTTQGATKQTIDKTKNHPISQLFKGSTKTGGFQKPTPRFTFQIRPPPLGFNAPQHCFGGILEIRCRFAKNECLHFSPLLQLFPLRWFSYCDVHSQQCNAAIDCRFVCTLIDYPCKLLPFDCTALAFMDGAEVKPLRSGPQVCRSGCRVTWMWTWSLPCTSLGSCAGRGRTVWTIARPLLLPH